MAKAIKLKSVQLINPVKLGRKLEATHATDKGQELYYIPEQEIIVCFTKESPPTSTPLSNVKLFVAASIEDFGVQPVNVKGSKEQDMLNAVPHDERAEIPAGVFPDKSEQPERPGVDLPHYHRAPGGKPFQPSGQPRGFTPGQPEDMPEAEIDNEPEKEKPQKKPGRPPKKSPKKD